MSTVDTTAAGAAIDVRNLFKSYDGKPAVQGIDLRIEPGEIFALLGPNGAGKTTTIEILEGYRRRDRGEVRVLGIDPDRQPVALKRRIGIVPQTTGMDRYLTVAETVSMYSNYYPHPRPTDEVLELVGLTEKRNQRVLKLSGGQQRRLDVAIALAGDPELLFLDEPTTGFDPTARRGAWEIVKNLGALGKTVILTTHYMDEAQYLADRVAVIANGHIVAEGTPDTIAGRDHLRIVVKFSVTTNLVAPVDLAISVGPDGVCQFTPTDLTRDLWTLTSWATQHGVTLEGLQIDRPSLEDVYLQLTADVTEGRSDPETGGEE